MELRELRIGNIIRTKGKNFPWEINREDMTKMYRRLNKDMDMSIYQPVDLTEETLLMIGAKKCSKTLYFPLTCLEAELHFEGIEFNGNFLLAPTIKSEHGYLILRTIKYVHEVQNLYFSLTGCELIRIR